MRKYLPILLVLIGCGGAPPDSPKEHDSGQYFPEDSGPACGLNPGAIEPWCPKPEDAGQDTGTPEMDSGHQHDHDTGAEPPKDAGQQVKDTGVPDTGIVTPTDAGHIHDAGTVADAGGNDHSDHMGKTVPYNKDTIPSGSAGTDKILIRNTSEKPGAGDGTGAFRIVCGLSYMNQDDPLVFPGMRGAAHLHQFFGNTNVNYLTTPESLQTNGNSTCRGGIINRSAYWTPAMIDTADGKVLKPSQFLVYYKSSYVVSPRVIKTVPSQLRVLSLAGNTTFSCDEFYPGRKTTMFDCGAGNTMIVQIHFPQCWNGKDLDSPDHNAHMAYPSGNGCPASHPVAIPEVTYNVYYKIPSSGIARWRLSSDIDTTKPAGYSSHADWIAAWQPEFIQGIVTNCVSKPADCHAHLLGDGREILDP